MAPRSFVVFQDTPSTNAQPKITKKATTSSTSADASTNSAFFLDKENVNPLTGERAGTQGGKKRKTSVLATKTTMPLGVKAQAESLEAKPEKKRKASVSQDKSSGKKAARSSASARRGTRRSPRRPPMPKVEEEAEGDSEANRLSQAEIDSRCYELTVQPLADVSVAYEASEPSTHSSHHSKLHFVKDSSAEPDLRDYITSAPEPKLFARATTPIESSHEATIFSTPERKRIYSAFTFSSPSPTSERYRKMNRATSVPPLQLGDKPSYTLPASSP